MSTLHVDAATLADLELLQARDGGPSVCDLMDRTATAAGARRLRALASEPPSDPEAIEANLRAIAFLAERAITFPVANSAWQAAATYLDSSYDTLRGTSALARRIEAAWIAVRYRGLLRHARQGAEAVGSMARQMLRLADRLDGLPAPDLLRERSSRLRELLDVLAPDDVGTSHRSLLELDRRMRSSRRSELGELLELVGELDLLCGAATLARAEGWCLPRVLRDDGGGGLRVEAEGVRHPFLPDAVPNPVALRGGETLVFLTGPNMAGKTTWLKGVALCVHLAHCGLPVPATRFRFTPLDGLFTSLSPEDHLRTGLSYFMAEVRRVRQVLEFVARGRRTLAIFDEVFRGTNVHDALEASRRVILGCARARRCGFIFSSHLVELARDLADEPSVRFLRFEGTIVDDRPHFDYTLQDGVSDSRFGLELLEREGVPALLEGIAGGAPRNG